MVKSEENISDQRLNFKRTGCKTESAEPQMRTGLIFWSIYIIKVGSKATNTERSSQIWAVFVLCWLTTMIYDMF